MTRHGQPPWGLVLFVASVCAGCSTSAPLPSSPASPSVPVATVRAVTITPAVTSLRVGGAQQYELRVELGDGIPPSIGPPQWNSSAPGVVSVTPGGLATAVAPGTATLSVQVRGGRDSLAIRATD